MINMKLIRLLGAICAGLLLVIFCEWMYAIYAQKQLLESVESVSKQKKAVAQLPSIELSKRPESSYTDLVTRPLFIQGRKPVNEPTNEPTPVSNTATETFNWDVNGIYTYQNKLYALLSRTTGKTAKDNYRKVTKDNDIDGWKLTDIQKDKVIVSQGSKQKELPLRKSKPKEPPSNPSNPQIAPACQTKSDNRSLCLDKHLYPFLNPCQNRHSNLNLSPMNQVTPTSRIAMMNNFSSPIKVVFILTLALTLSSCELLSPRHSPKIPLTPVLKDQKEGAEGNASFKDLQNKTPNNALQSKIEMFPARDWFAPRTESHRRSSKPGGPGTYSLNFDDADLGEVAKVILSDILGENYVLSPKVTGKVTLNTKEPLSKAELLPTLEMVLSMNNAALVKDGKIYHIEPKTEALYSASVAGGSSTGFQSRVIPIRNVAAQEIADILKPLVHEKTILTVDSNRNTIVVQGTSDELARVMDMVSTFDTDVLRGKSFALFPLNNVAPEQVIEELEAVFSTPTGKEDSEFFRFLPIERMNAVLAITQQPSYLRDVENWVYRLDRANTESGGGVNVYKVQHMDAEELAGTLNEIFTGAGPRDKSAKVAAGKKSSEVSNKDSFDSNNSQKTDKTLVKRKKELDSWRDIGQ